MTSPDLSFAPPSLINCCQPILSTWDGRMISKTLRRESSFDVVNAAFRLMPSTNGKEETKPVVASTNVTAPALVKSSSAWPEAYPTDAAA